MEGKEVKDGRISYLYTFKPGKRLKCFALSVTNVILFSSAVAPNWIQLHI